MHDVKEGRKGKKEGRKAPTLKTLNLAFPVDVRSLWTASAVRFGWTRRTTTPPPPPSRSAERVLVFGLLVRPPLPPARAPIHRASRAQVMTARIMERGRSSGRIDDNEEAIRKRLVTYHESTMPIIKQFEAMGKLREINSDQTIGELYVCVLVIVRGRGFPAVWWRGCKTAELRSSLRRRDSCRR